jgi:CheY-like chemotaxis protein
MKRYRILWVEDGARFDLPHLAAPVFMDGNYDLCIVENVADCIAYVQTQAFDVIVLDIRIPPGDDQQWISLYKKAGTDKVSARLGLKLLYSLIGSNEAEINLNNRPSWIAPDKIGIFTVESKSELDEHLQKLGIHVYQQKKADVAETVLIDLIKHVIQHNETQSHRNKFLG